MRKKRPENKSDNYWIRYGGLASEFFILLGGATFLGYKLDKKLDFHYPIFIIIFPILALVIALWRLIKTVGNGKDG